MNYSFFLFAQLYNEIVGIQYEYDQLFEDLNVLFSQYNDSPFNDEDQPEYECIVAFLNHHKDSIRKGCAERGICLAD